MKDIYTKTILISRLNAYKNYYQSALLHSKIRKPNFPEDISENIIKNFIGESCNWDTKVGDLFCQNDGKIEVKCFSSDGPISFGANEKWDLLYILDSKDFMNGNFIL